MESKRQRQVAEQIKRNFSLVLQQEGSYIYGPEPLVTVTEVHPTPDLSLCKIYVSIWNTDNKQDVIIKMNEEHQRLKNALAQRIRKHIRRIPAISFFIDETLDEMNRVETLFDRLEEEGQLPKE
ncbi:30S ribosome-binding factor RbfA [Neolewinella aurantiaca]|uniref:Ribosome-binding factor A n=1 Tax=Neolewinella aurantiaca TaxID=2602767 RepID=A0A5C7FSY5_9BACT|nr:30S ribosome-binding factor RbfA [Neolewinella aurantiaca]TXF89555.1 30S ribosome-binding factor RbfA [Neolewinella aurantiaca]